MIFSSLKLPEMWLSRLNKMRLFLFLLLIIGVAGNAQDAISSVKLQKINAQLFRIQYQLTAAGDYSAATVLLKIYRRRSGLVEEIFSGPVTPTKLQANKMYSFNWQTSATSVKDGDELQAKIIVSYNKTAAAKPVSGSKNNQPPKAHAGEFVEIQLPVQSPLQLDGSKSTDNDGKIVSVNWKQIGGPNNIQILRPDSLRSALSGDIKEGRYAFELTVRDEFGASSSDRVIVTIKPSLVTAPLSATPDPTTNTTGMEHAADTSKIPANNKPGTVKEKILPPPSVVSKRMPKLKGGPGNAFINLALPGIGHYLVSGDHHGRNRKAGSFIITAAYAGSLGGAFYFRKKYLDEYNQYKELAAFREVQTDANGNIIGVRGIESAKTKQQFDAAKNARRNALILLGAAGTILTGDFIYTLIRGSKNRQAWKKEAAGTTGVFLSSEGMQISAGIRFKF